MTRRRDSARLAADAPVVTTGASKTTSGEPSFGEPSFDYHLTLHVLRDNLGKADAYITAAENLIEQPGVLHGGGDGDNGDEDSGVDSLNRRQTHVEHLVESAKLAVRAAIRSGGELDRPWGA